MKNITKRFFFYLLLLTQLIVKAGPGDNCSLAVLATDLSTASTEFKVLVKESNGLNAWFLLNKEAPALRTNIEELALVSKNLDEINNVGGYAKWKQKIDGRIEWVVLESKLSSKLSSSIEISTLNKMITQMKNAGEGGYRLALRIEKGTYQGIEGYTNLIKNSSVDQHSLKSVNQALDKADNLVASGTNKSPLRFEDNPSGYDVDLGIKTYIGLHHTQKCINSKPTQHF